MPDEQSINTNRGSSHNQQPLRSRRSRRRTRRARTRRKGWRAVGGTIDEGRTLVEGKFSFIFGPGNGSESTAEREEVGGNVCHDVTGCIRRHARARVCMCICPAPLGFWARALLFIMRSASKGYLGTRGLRVCCQHRMVSQCTVQTNTRTKKRTKKNLPKKPLPQACLIMV